MEKKENSEVEKTEQTGVDGDGEKSNVEGAKSGPAKKPPRLHF